MKFIKQSLLLAALFGGILISAKTNAQIITVPQSGPYTNDANTILLEHFDGTTTGTPNGAVTYTNGVFGQAVHLNAGAWASWNLGSLSQGTVEFWGKLDTLTNSGGVWPAFVGSFYSQFYAETFDVWMTTNALVSAYHNGATWITTGMLPSPVITSNTWHHYATTWGNQGFHFYVDGNLVYSNTVTSAQNPSTGWWCIGGQSALAPGYNGDDFTGEIDELRISNVQRVFAPGPSVNFVKAFTVDYSNLLIGSNYQAQASPDLVNWTNWGTAFSATNSSYTNTNYQRIGDRNQLFFRLVQH